MESDGTKKKTCHMLFATFRHLKNINQVQINLSYADFYKSILSK